MFQLAHALGKDADEIKAMDSSQFAEWQVYFDVIKEEQESGHGKRVERDPNAIQRFFSRFH